MPFICQFTTIFVRITPFCLFSQSLRESQSFHHHFQLDMCAFADVLLRQIIHEDVKSFIIDCEAVAYDVQNKQILPFQVLSTRKRKDASTDDITVQVCLYAFDLLYLNGTDRLMEKMRMNDWLDG